MCIASEMTLQSNILVSFFFDNYAAVRFIILFFILGWLVDFND